MKHNVNKIMITVVFAAVACVQTNAKAHLKSIVVESPANLPEMAQRSSQAMYLLHLASGQAIFYLEQDQGRSLAILDVTDPGRTRALGQVAIAAPSPYDFVETLTNSAVLIRYRDDNGFAVIHFKKFKQPLLTEAKFGHSALAEALGHDALLFASTAPSSSLASVSQYEVFDTSNPSEPATLVTVEGVRERLERIETGTLFLLGNAGLTVIRRPAMEEEYRIESTRVN